MLHRPSLILAPLVGVLVLTLPELARACGGTFCDNGTQMAVDQTGEDILFVREGAEVEAHVRIQYEGEPERFAWLVPLQAVPTVSVGSEPLFVALSQATAPTWQAAREYECPEDEPGWDSDGGEGLSFIAESDIPSASDPEVVFETVVGSFEVIVLQGGTAAEVIDFLQANDYLQDPESEPILQEYLDEGFLFAAVKLVAGAEVEAIHPLVFRMLAEEPCVPIRLTRIAAKPDMGIRAYFLGQDRWAPSNYKHVVLNPIAYDWQVGSLPRYLEVLTLAVDEAGGRAFATDYAGSSDVVGTSSVYDPLWDETAFVEADPILAIALIADQNLNFHQLIRSLLLQYIPPPDGLTPNEFWNDIEYYADQIDQSAWDGPAFAAALAEQIIEPGLHAVDLLDAWPKLTRLHTTISPAEMTLDPTFHANPDLPDVANEVVTTAQVMCADDLPYGDEVYSVVVEGAPTPVCVPSGEGWPTIAGMPNVLKIEQIPMAGPPQTTVDLTEAALALLAAQQESVECAAMGSGETGDGDSGDGDGTSSSGQDDVADDGESGPSYDLPYDTTCGCATSSGETPLAIGLGLLVLGLIAPRRRRS
jgi:MYXO-CTERM domain-containing protein